MSLAKTIFILIFLSICGAAHAQSYRFIDESGNIHFVDRLNQVPPKFRNQIEGLPPTPVAVPDKKGKGDKGRSKDQDKEKQREKIRLEKERKKRDEQMRRQREKEMKKQQRIQKKQTLIPRYDDGIGLPSVPVAQPPAQSPQILMPDSNAAAPIPGFELPSSGNEP